MKKKPSLRLAKLDEPNAIDIAILYEKITGKKMSSQDIEYAEQKLRNADAQLRSDPARNGVKTPIPGQ